MDKKIIVEVVAVAIIVVAVILIMTKSSTPVNNSIMEPQNAPVKIPSSANAPTFPPFQTGPPGPMAQVALINIQNFQFDSASFTVKKGTTIVWNNSDSMPHTVTSDEGSELASPSIEHGGTYPHTFNSVGTFTYHCAIHPSMKGTVVVTD